MATSDIIARLARDGWIEKGQTGGWHVHLAHPSRRGVITLPVKEMFGRKTVQRRGCPNPVQAILSRRRESMACYYAAFFKEDNGISVLFPDMPGCQTFGTTQEEAFAKAVDALSGHIEVLSAEGEPFPSPSGRGKAMELLRVMCADSGIAFPQPPELPDLQLIPALDQDASLIRVSVSFRKATLTMIDRKADAEGMTRSGFLAAAAAKFESTKRQ